MTRLVVLGFLALIVYQLAAGLWHLLQGDGRTAQALTRRVGLSVLLILLVLAGIATGMIEPHFSPR